MQLIPSCACILLAATLIHGGEAKPAAKLPDGPLTELEQRFVGKWSGMRAGMRWEIERKADRTFEVAFIEPDEEGGGGEFRNCATGVWWVEGRNYHFEWRKWWGDEGEFGGVQTEVVDAVTADKVVTLSDDDDHPRNVEMRVEKFKMKAWQLKPAPAPAQAGERARERAQTVPEAR